jgi:hypothetical protein
MESWRCGLTEVQTVEQQPIEVWRQGCELAILWGEDHGGQLRWGSEAMKEN